MGPLESNHWKQSHPPAAPEAGRELTQLAMWMAATLAGLVTAVLLARGPFFRRLLKSVGRGKKRIRRPTPAQSLPMLAGTIVGSSRATIESVLGPPRSAALKGIGIITFPKMVFWHADTWYYPLPRNGPMAMAINFADDFATQVEFFSTPSPPAKLV